jgi:hypothetical protein
MYKIIGADQKEYGPINADQLRQWIAEGRVNGNTKVKLEGTEGWKSISELPEFATSLPAVPPPPTPMLPPSAVPSTAPMPQQQKANPLAVWSMVTGILGLLCCQILAPVAIVLGIVAQSQLKQNPQQTGSGFAIVGIVLGIISLILLIVVIALAVSNPGAFNFGNMG